MKRDVDISMSLTNSSGSPVNALQKTGLVVGLAGLVIPALFLFNVPLRPYGLFLFLSLALMIRYETT